ncbi:hypothetical protein EPO17_03525 [Patescibacteria group bacterium]|nr:MAG: hypothetical protein EPO17_03525 [Patescibacteria group bacterium]
MKVNQWTIGLAAAGVISFGPVAQNERVVSSNTAAGQLEIKETAGTYVAKGAPHKFAAHGFVKHA